ncbi:hypothetical protein A3860_36520 [Niastella vici]|uniref:Response regulatory domain-containing protein n=1 Tax=Niastella vici TaxID=1703345 RepID=A0A1V9FMZ6_9BACT|nr:response regulator [Niastella vici]OQP59677.1 hypothetical protein A3860_36520 [Niastella vici]
MENNLTKVNTHENKKKGKVLVIEDNPDWIDYLKKHLEKAGFFVLTASNLTMAKQMITSDRFHFITIDMQLVKDTERNKFEGWDILAIVKYLNLEDTTTPCMVVTAHPEDYIELSPVKQLKSMFFMSKKAFDKRQFVETIERVIATKNIQFKDDQRGD